ncbi:acyl-CoA thioesterase [Caldimonas tepidiphila]|uniref:acyl-CoA thioesterase n=1 Tax=Caldimonas tepidiphila TaxID=2315841 RepID=UPI000E5BE13F|nr:acyl-CoA thioesterase [Caldimonas tepidiphila]
MNAPESLPRSPAAEAEPAAPADSDALHKVAVEFGDCDPAGIVYFPNFYRWMDAASRHYFVHRGVPAWRETERRWGVIGTPIVDAQTRFLRPASYGDRLAIETEVIEWRGKSFVQRHRIWCDGKLLVEGTEVRVFAAHREGGGIRAVEAPEIRALCEG